MTQRTLIARSLLVLAVLGLAVLMFFIGKGHSFYLDTHKLTVDGVEYRAPDMVTVTVDRLPPEEMFANDRVKVSVMGQRHRIRLEFADGSAPLEREFRVPLSLQEAVISVTAVAAGLPDSQVVAPLEQASEEDFGQAGQFFMQQDPATEAPQTAPAGNAESGK